MGFNASDETPRVVDQQTAVTAQHKLQNGSSGAHTLPLNLTRPGLAQWLSKSHDTVRGSGEERGAVKPKPHVKDLHPEILQQHLAGGQTFLLQQCAAHLSGNKEWLDLESNSLNLEKLHSFLAELLREYYQNEKLDQKAVNDEHQRTPLQVVEPEQSPIWKELVQASDRAMPNDGFMEAQKPLTDSQLDYLLDEIRGFPDDPSLFEPTDPSVRGAEPAEAAQSSNFKVAICGAGIHGLSVAMRLERLGVDYVLLERDCEITGTWWQNRYPGVRCDTPSITYSFSSDPNPRWKKFFADGKEVYDYLKMDLVMKKYPKILEKTRLNTVVEQAKWIEADKRWEITYRRKRVAQKFNEFGADKGIPDELYEESETLYSNVYVAAVGQLSNPFVPKIKGQEELEKRGGIHFHTARYPLDADGKFKNLDFAGKKVVVVGTGATAMGICPEIYRQQAQESASSSGCRGHLTIFQSTPQWYVDIPNHKKKITDSEQWCMEFVPFYERWYRFFALRHILDFYVGDLEAGSQANKRLESVLTEYIKNAVGHDPELVEKMVPKHPPICTRMLVDNHWCKMLKEGKQSGKVTLINERCNEIPKDADIVIYATGFQSTKFCTASCQIYGAAPESGKQISLQEDWGGEPTAYLGMTRPNFPNFFMTYGPNTNVSSGGSIVWCAETAGRYIAHACKEMQNASISSKTISGPKISVKDSKFREYNEYITKELKWTAWADEGCRSWYKTGATGKVTNNLPMGLEAFTALTRKPDLVRDFDCEF